MVEPVVIFITTPDEETAAKIARTLVEEKLAACANIVKGVRSIYSWKGETCDDSECLMVVKTVLRNFDALSQRVAELHPYEVPEIIAVPVVGGHKPYLLWLEENTRLA
ncbi:MAG: divalent-cation tolerance protein CutA [Nitrospirota bacterium]